MARRKRLSPASLTRAHAFQAALEPLPERVDRAAAPIAQTAGEAAEAAAAEIARLRSAAADGDAARAALAEAEAAGRMVVAVPLEAVETGYLPRDRMVMVDEDEAFRSLKESLRQSGQRVPVDLVALRDGRYGLIAGWRRIQALAALHWETGEDRFATVAALVRTETPRADAFRAMVDENELRADLSHYERGRICALAAESGAFETPEAAVDGLFATAPAPRRSKIRSFLAVHRALGDLLAYPEHIPERLGLALARALKWGGAEAMRAELSGKAAGWSRPEDEQAALKAALDVAAGQAPPGYRGTAPQPAGQPGEAPGPARAVELPGGRRLELWHGREQTEFHLSGPALPEAALLEAFAALAERLRS